MNNVKIELELQSPLSHFGDERLGTMQIARTNKFKFGDEFVDIPVYSGNAFRGQLRRCAMRDFIERLGLVDKGISEKLYYALFTGGTLISGSRFEEIGENLNIQKMCPPLALFGSALGDRIIQGKLKSSIFIPVCKETEYYTEEKSEISFYDMLEDVFYTRRDDLKSVSENVEKSEKKKENPVQMKYEAQCLAAGTKLVGNLVLENANAVEKSCLSATLKNFANMPYIGGKSSAGHGRVKIEMTDLIEDSIYYEYLEEHKDAIIMFIENLEKALK